MNTKTLVRVFASFLLWPIGCNSSSVPPETSTSSKNETAPATSPADAAPWFKDVTGSTGIQFTHDRGPLRHWIPEITCGGAAWIDYDEDGWIDLYLIQGGDLLGKKGPNSTSQTSVATGNRLFRNLGHGKFEDVTARAGVGDTHYGMGVAVGDYDSDGHLDLYVTNVGPNVLYRNRGDGTFEDVSEQAGVAHPGWGTAAAFADYDEDGNVDLYVVNYLNWSPDSEVDCRSGDNLRDYCAPSAYKAPAMDVLYRNRGDGTFEDVSLDAGLDAAVGTGLGLAVADFNEDGKLDFYVANDGMPNQLWTQDRPGHFRDEAMSLGCAVDPSGTAEAGMGVAAVDIENDGDLDLFMTHLTKETNTLYVRKGKYFDDETARFNLAAPSLSYTGFGLGFVDFDHDGRLDLFIANGRVARYGKELVPGNVYAEPNLLFRGTEVGFAEVSPQGGTYPVLVENSRAAAFADFDHDGDVDTLVVNNGGQPRLLSNEIGNTKNWVRLRVLNVHGADAVGARVGVTSHSQTQWRIVGRCYGYLSSHEPELHFGLGTKAQVDSVKVVWANGTQQTLHALPAQTIHTVQQRP